MANRYDLAGRTALVTGAAGDIGGVVAGLLQESGARVAGWDLTPPPPGRTLDHWQQVDVTDEAAVEQGLTTTLAKLGSVDILVAAAGILGPVAPMHEQDLATWRRVMAINLDGTFLCLRAFVRHRLACPAPRFGRAILLGSQQGKEGMALGSAYSVSKAGVMTLAKSVGKELARTGVLVHAVSPTAIESRMANDITAERRADILGRIPMGRFGETIEVARLVAWLASPDCSFTTGAVFDLSGGRATY